mgnify:CR=1 FL=1
MCGIVGIVHGEPGRKVDEHLLRLMTDVMQYRGPDDSGIWLGDGLGLGHRRLSIIDLAGGHQPMTTGDSGLWITFNGEIYNYLELRALLEADGYTCQTNSDTEVLLNMYRRGGQACLEQLNGMFAFALWDSEKRRLFAARDRLGIKPFYYACVDGMLLFASEIKALLLHPAIQAEVHFDALQDYIDLQYCLGDKTLFKGIHRLLPGHCLTWQDSGLSVEKYWDLDFNSAEQTGSQEALADLLRDAVRLRLRSDVPVGTFLSGGLDSSAIACLAAPQLDTPLSVFTGGFSAAERYDESRYARIVADSLGARYHQVFPTAEDLAGSFDEMVYYLDEPVAGAAVFPQYFLSKLASQHVKVVLGGQGGDELFCGYTRYLIGYVESCMQKAIYGSAPLVGEESLSSLQDSLTYLRGFEPTMQKLFASDLFSAPGTRYYRLLQRSQDMEGILANSGWRDGSYSTAEAFCAEFDGVESDQLIDRMLYMDIKNHLQSLLHLEDRTSMAASLESRLPLLDYRLVEYALAQPASSRFARGRLKHLLKEAVRGIVPDEIIDRKDKMGFPVPIFEWFGGELKEYVEDILLGERTKGRGFFDMEVVEQSVRGEKPFGRTVWGLLSLELWFRQFFDAR